MSRKLTIDVVLLSYAKDEKRKLITLRCLESISRQTVLDEHRIRVIIGESEPSIGEYDYANSELYQKHANLSVHTIPIGKPFSFNRAVVECIEFADCFPVETDGNNCILVSNNDVIYNGTCFAELVKALRVVDSASPWMPVWHNRLHDCDRPKENIILGYQVPYHLTGWSYAFNRRIIGIGEYLKLDKLFPPELSFWFQDNFYADALRHHGIKHAIIRDAQAIHQHESSHDLLDNRAEQTAGMRPVYEQLRDQMAGSEYGGKGENFLLTVAVAAVPQRLHSTGSRLLEKLRKQAEGFPVEILSIVDNSTIKVGRKRDELLRLAQGQFVAFVDDDDDVKPDYISSLVKAIRFAPFVDVIVFETLVSVDGGPWKECVYDLHGEMVDGEVYERLPNHICCWRRELALTQPHMDVNWGEDNWWSFEIIKKARTQYRIDKPLYVYHYNSHKSLMRQDGSFPVETNERALKIAVYSICKDEAVQIRDYMNSIADADYIIVGDTGSTDGSQDILRSMGATVYDVIVNPWKFDVARNTVLSLVPADVDVVIKLDLDERMGEGWRAAIERHWVKGETTRLNYDFHYEKNWHYRASWIHARHGYHWHWPIHEFVACVSGNEKTVEVPVGELYTTHHKIHKESRGQYLPMLKEFARTTPGPRSYYYLGREYMYAGKHQDCIDTLKKYLALDDATWHSERCAAAMHIASSYYSLGNPGAAEAWLHRAISEECWSREPYVELALRLYRGGQHALAYGTAIKALSITHRPGHSFTTAQGWNETAEHIASVTAWELGMKDKAIEHLNNALAINPNNKTLLGNKKFFGMDANSNESKAEDCDITIIENVASDGEVGNGGGAERNAGAGVGENLDLQ
jgi:tetratricopeptide (TPR) repeat protein